ncbi:LysR family transcriptional regulator [Salsuginibacillus halophilus]|uniref:LysR family transcriptional regulator n=1 Tax=Salsuginibacillus halophilus TaxID=517424 RepID=A0A2P8HL12_9BACI|nr:selenium metabolism-associated LysR family transcriptional regulator [Salsuginibacillus halophilus]PSL46908.1 LysR family transcriptional regulator [Salsuginibacillus halophilus]
MNNDQLQAFTQVARTKSFSEAGRALFVSQPTITSQIKSLEEELGAPLFHRTKKFVQITPAGEKFLTYAQQMLDLQMQAKNEIGALNGELQGTLAVASSLTIGESILPALLHDFKKAHPYINLKTEITNSQHIVEMIQRGEFEIGLIEADLQVPDLQSEAFMSDELVLFAAPHVLKDSEAELDLETLKEIPLVMREEGSGTRSVFESRLEAHGWTKQDLNIELELGSTESVKAAVEAGMGAAILSKSAVRKELELGLIQTYRIKDLNLKRNFYIVRKKDRALQLVSEMFYKTIMAGKFSE